MNTIPTIKKLGTKLTIFSIIIAVIPILTLGMVSTTTITDTMEIQAQQKITNDLKIAENIVNNKIEKLHVAVVHTANAEETVSALKNGDSKKLKEMAKLTKESAGADFVTIFDNRGRVIARSNNEVIGDYELPNLIKKVLNGTEINSIEMLDEETLKMENLENDVEINISKTYNSADVDKSIENKGMALVSIKPIKDHDGNIVGAIVAADVLNGDYTVVDKVKEITGDTATIFLEGLRISTNVQKEDSRAIGTLVSKEVYHEVINNGETYNGRAFVVTDWYLTAYKPIRNSEGDIIGMLFVGTPEKPFITLENNIRNQSIIVGIIGLSAALGVSLVLNRKITRPLEELKKGAELVSSGNYNSRVEVKTADEFGELAKAFNKMAEEIWISHEKLKKHAEELEKSYNELKELDKMKSDIIVIVSHELRTPLTSIKGYVELVLDGTMGPITESQRKCLEIAEDNIKRLKRLIESMLDLSKIERGELEMNMEEIGIKHFVEKILSSLKPLADEKNINMNHDVEDIAIKGDKDRIAQVLTNLVENAIKFTPINGNIGVNAFKENEYAHITVTDNGPGIPEKDLCRIFDRFYQVDSSAKRKKGGSGLGLAVCKSIVEAHGGSIWVESKHGKGSTFHILLPLNQDEV